jgi:hypothetical protein
VGRVDRKPATIAIDRKLFKLLKAIGIVHQVPLRELIERTLIAALTSNDIYAVHERETFDILARLYGLNLYDLAEERQVEYILSRERRPRRGKRRAKKKVEGVS